ncbi:hypothetical protein BC833DRAFT_597862 [Globomyces pollinis-pini]|nr:hypothetical protein BC833DRAFT_597862 [Globomyces pollinis-pini]
MTFNYAWGLFGFIWVITALSVSIPLLILFPVGFPLLYFSCVSFRAMARLELEILSYFWNVPINKKQFPILVSRDQGIVTHMKNQVLSIENLVCILYFVVIKFIISQIMFVVALLGFISVIFLFITPLFLHAAKYSSKLELFFIQKILK